MKNPKKKNLNRTVIQLKLLIKRRTLSMKIKL